MKPLYVLAFVLAVIVAAIAFRVAVRRRSDSLLREVQTRRAEFV